MLTLRIKINLDQEFTQHKEEKEMVKTMKQKF
jgi:hypothetical protein